MSKLLKSKILFGLVVVAIMFVGVVAVSSTASADCTITSTLRVGSTGSEVSCLQSKVGATADGVFGPMTKAAVQAFQTNNGLVADGVVGPITRGALGGVMASTGGTSVALCPNGMTIASNCAAAPATTSVALCPNGMTIASNCAASPTAGTTSGAEGSVTVTYAAVPSNALAVNKGETKDVIGINIKATGSDMTVSRLWLDVNARIWLYADSISVLDGSTVIATLPLSQSTVEEITPGSSYTVKMEGFSFVVPKDTTKTLTVKISRPTLTTSSGDVTVAATSSVRAVDGAGITDTYTLPSARTLNLANVTAATGTMTNTLAASTPVTQSISGLSTTAGNTTAVKLLDFDLKATDGAVNVTAITGHLASGSGNTCIVSECVASVELRDGSTVLDSVTGSPTLSFGSSTALDIDVAAGATKTLSVWGIINHVASSYVVAGDSITASITATTGTSGASFTAANTSNTVTGNAQYLFQYAPTFALVNTGANPTSATQVDESTSTTTTKSANYQLSFSVTAPAGSAIYVDVPSTIQVQNYAASPSIPGASKLSNSYGGTLTTSYTISGESNTGSTSGYDLINAGQTRIITVSGYIPHGTAAGYAGMRIAAVKWNTTDATSGTTTQSWGLSAIKTPTAYVTLN